MNNIPLIYNRYKHTLILSALMLFLSLIFSSEMKAQGNRLLSGEAATCTINRSSRKIIKGKANANIIIPAKTYVMKVNQLGSFDQLSGIQPLETVPVEIAYPSGNKGEKVLLSAKDGGRFSNGKKVQLLELNAQKKVVFNFQVSDQAGIFRIGLRKGNDIKVVQLWVGTEAAAAKN